MEMQFLGIFQDNGEQFIVCEYLEKGIFLIPITKEKDLSIVQLLRM